MTRPLSLDELQALCEAATPGPWLYGPLPDVDNVWPITLEPEGRGVGVIANCFSESDRELVVAAVTALPDLIAQIRTLQAEGSRLKAELNFAANLASAAQTESERLTAKLDEAQTRAEEAERIKNMYCDDLNRAEQRVREAEAELDELKGDDNP